MSVRFDAQGEKYASSGSMPSGDWTVLCWAALAVDRNAFSGIWEFEAGSSNYVLLETDTTGTDLDVQTQTSAGNVDLTTGPTMVVDTWYRIAVTKSGTSVTLYTATATGPLTLAGPITIGAFTPTGFHIGGSQSFATEWWNGRVADVKQYSAVLTPSQMVAELGTWSAVSTSNLVRHYKLKTAVTTDDSGNGNTLTGGTGAATDASDPPITDAIPTAPAPVMVRGSVADATAATTSSVTLTAPTTITVGNYLIARVAVDNSGGSGAAPGCTVTDPRSNTWTVLGPALVDPGAAAAGATAYLAYTKVATAYQAADALTFNWGGISTTAKAVVVEEWTNIHATTPVAVSAVTANAAASTAVSVSITPTAANQLVYTCLATEGIAGDTVGADADTTNGTWVTLTTTASANATATNNQRVSGQYKVVTASGAQSWDSTITSRDWAAIAVVFQPPPTPTSLVLPPDPRRSRLLMSLLVR